MNNSLKKIIVIRNKIFLICCLSSAIFASLMMSNEEMTTLSKISPLDALEPQELVKLPSTDSTSPQPEILQEILFVSAILHFNQSHWTVWINDKTYTTDYEEDENLKILKVSVDLVEIELKNTEKKIIKLRANQSLMPLGYRIVDGDARHKVGAILL